tara:strand:- start:29 stop:238 length:210 start_codon:yes stop_codon:yes gene_type:complete
MEDWWETLYEQMLKVSLFNLMRMEEIVDESDSIEAIQLLMEAADHFQFLQKAYHDRCGADIHVEFFLCD